MHAVILAGGKGVRLRPYTTTLPKPLVPIGDQHAILEIVLRSSPRRASPRHPRHRPLGNMIRAYVGDGSPVGHGGRLPTEEHPLGTIGPLLTLLDRLPERLPGDERRHPHRPRLRRCSLRTPGRRPADDRDLPRARCTSTSACSTTRAAGLEFTEKPTIDYRVSMGVYGVIRSTLTYNRGLPLGFDELVLDLLGREQPAVDYAFDGYWLDIGRPDDYDRANAEFTDAAGPRCSRGRDAGSCSSARRFPRHARPRAALAAGIDVVSRVDVRRRPTETSSSTWPRPARTASARCSRRSGPRRSSTAPAHPRRVAELARATSWPGGLVTGDLRSGPRPGSSTSALPPSTAAVPVGRRSRRTCRRGRWARTG